MKLYNLLIEEDKKYANKSKIGKIWCTDGSFLDPLEFLHSYKEAYGYVLDKHTAVSLKKLKCGRWSYEGTSYYDPSRSNRTVDVNTYNSGLKNSNRLRGFSDFSIGSCPAVYQACTQVNAGVVSYMPSVKELEDLYYSIMNGSMRMSLKIAGIHELCNYRNAYNSDNGWSWIWSSTESLYSTAYYVDYFGFSDTGNKSTCSLDTYVIPFFNI